MILTLKYIILIMIQKKIRLTAGSLPGVTLGGEYYIVHIVIFGPLRGAFFNFFFLKINQKKNLTAVFFW